MSDLSPRARVISRAGAALAAAGTAFAYINGWDLWQVLTLCALIPGIPLYVRFYNGRFGRYRFLVGIYVVAGAVSLFEFWQFGHFPESVAKTIDLPPGAGDMQGLRQFQLSHVLNELYPDNPETLVRNAKYGPICVGDDTQLGESVKVLREQHPYCQSLRELGNRSARQWYERSLERKPKKHEDTYYHYVRILLEAGAERREVDAAADRWKVMFPHSRRPDPREAFTGGAWFRDAPSR